MNNSTIAIVVVVVLAVIGGGYWFGTHQTVQENVTAPAGVAYMPGNLLLGTDATTTVGTHLIGSNGMTLYAFANDTDGVSNCTGECAQNWEPYLVNDLSVLANLQSGVDGTASTTLRADGGMQVTYGGAPLYFYIGDKTSGEVNGEGVKGLWHVVKTAKPTTAPVVGIGAHCGGFIQNAPTCSLGLHCQLTVGRPDTGGVCVKDTVSTGGGAGAVCGPTPTQPDLPNEGLGYKSCMVGYHCNPDVAGMTDGPGKCVKDPMVGGGVVCTQEAMACPGGGYVSRSGPNCEFAACPER